MSRAKKPKAPVLWVVLDRHERAVTCPTEAEANDCAAFWDESHPHDAPHRVVKYVPEKEKR